jgi:TolB-like protein/DNA-binding SARP family transcriptional activator/Tfp pilus assembly protein PilF
MGDSVQISLRVLGGFAVVIAGSPVSELRISSRKACALLAYLAMRPDRRATREHLASFFWGHDEHARQSLRQCLSSLRSDLANAPAEILVVGPDVVGLRSENLAVDATEFLALADSSEISDLDRAVALYRGEFLSEFDLGEPFNGWVRKTRIQLDGAAARVFETRAKLTNARGEGEQAIHAVERLLALDPLREDWQRLALKIYVRYQGRERALTHADALVALLKTKLGAEPEAATRVAIDAIRRGDAGANGAEPQVSLPDRDVSTLTGQVGLFNPLLDGRLSAIQDTNSLATLTAGVARAWERATHWSLGTGASIAVAGLITVSAVGLMIGGRKTTSQSGAVMVVNTPDTGSVAARHVTANATKRATKPIALPPGLVPIVVLPFAADDDDGPIQKAADSLTDDLISALSRFAVVRVISRQTAFTYKGRPVDAADVGVELGVRYAVEGSFRVAGSKAGVNFQLVDAADRLQVLSDHVEWDGSDRLAGQDEIATRIARELKTGVTIAASERSVHAQEPDVDALVMQGWSLSYRAPSRENLAKELALFEAALRRDPDLEPALEGAALALITATVNSLADDPEGNLDRARELLDRALEMAPNSYRVHFGKGMVYKARGDYEAALRSLSNCVDINPSAAIAHSQIAAVLTRLGRPKEGFDYIQYAMRLSPRDPAVGTFYIIAGEAELELRHDDAAAGWFKRAIASQPHNPSGYLYLAASFALMGDKQNAATYWAEFRNRSAAAAFNQLIDRLRADKSARLLRSRFDEGLRIASAS